MGQTIYYDNSATTKVLKEVAETATYYMTEQYENPSSPYKPALKNERLVGKARQTLMDALGAGSGDLIFTSGGTEANNIAIQGAVTKNRGSRVITSAIEHLSVLDTCKFVSETKNVEFVVLGVDERGHILLDELEDAVNDETVIVSVMHVNNEVGTIQDIKALSQMIKGKNPKCLLHVDGVQALGKVPIDVERWGVDLYSISAHKTHGPKGVGALYVRESKRIAPVFYGGGQESGFRPGTYNVPGIAAFEKAVDITMSELEETKGKMGRIKKDIYEALKKAVPGCHLIGDIIDKSAPHILNIAFEGIRGEVLLHAVEQEGLIINIGSACSSKKKKISHVLKAMGIHDRLSEGAVRLSLSSLNTLDEVDKAVDIIVRNVKRLRRFA